MNWWEAVGNVELNSREAVLVAFVVMTREVSVVWVH